MEEICCKGTGSLMQRVFFLNEFCTIDAFPSYHIAIDIIHAQFLSIIFISVFTFLEHSCVVVLMSFSVIPAPHCSTFCISNKNSAFSFLVCGLSTSTQTFYLFLTNRIHFPYWIRRNPMFPLNYCTLQDWICFLSHFLLAAIPCHVFKAQEFLGSFLNPVLYPIPIW